MGAATLQLARASRDAALQLLRSRQLNDELTRSEDRDWVAGTPWHKHTPARVEAL